MIYIADWTMPSFNSTLEKICFSKEVNIRRLISQQVVEIVKPHRKLADLV